LHTFAYTKHQPFEYSQAAQDEGTNVHPPNRTVPRWGFKSMLQSRLNVPTYRSIALIYKILL